MGAITFKCPNCGGELIFDPASQKYVCEYCDSVFTQQQLDAMAPASGQEHTEQGYDEEGTQGGGENAAQPSAGQSAQGAGQASSAQGAQGTAAGAVVYSCPSCGAQIVTSDTTAATFCYYCHNPVVLEGRLSGDYLPDSVIPFKITKEEAKERFLSFVRKKRYVPHAFFSDGQIDKMTGVYYPYWVYDCKMNGGISGEATKVRVWVSGETEYTETTRFDVERSGSIAFNGLIRNALKNHDRDLVEHVLPFELHELKPFSMGYLAGFQAEKRDMEQKEFSTELKNETKQYARSLMEDTVKVGRFTIKDSRFAITEEIWHYCLLPVWVLTFRGRGGELFYYALNGQTGDVAGKLPVDQRKLWTHAGILGLVVLIIGLIAGYLI